MTFGHGHQLTAAIIESIVMKNKNNHDHRIGHN